MHQNHGAFKFTTSFAWACNSSYDINVRNWNLSLSLIKCLISLKSILYGAKPILISKICKVLGEGIQYSQHIVTQQMPHLEKNLTRVVEIYYRCMLETSSMVVPFSTSWLCLPSENQSPHLENPWSPSSIR
jgi:hypothetical protein